MMDDLHDPPMEPTSAESTTADMLRALCEAQTEELRRLAEENDRLKDRLADLVDADKANVALRSRLALAEACIDDLRNERFCGRAVAHRIAAYDAAREGATFTGGGSTSPGVRAGGATGALHTAVPSPEPPSLVCECGHYVEQHLEGRIIGKCEECEDCFEFYAAKERATAASGGSVMQGQEEGARSPVSAVTVTPSPEPLCECGHPFATHATFRAVCFEKECDCQGFRPATVQGPARERQLASAPGTETVPTPAPEPLKPGEDVKLVVLKQWFEREEVERLLESLKYKLVQRAYYACVERSEPMYVMAETGKVALWPSEEKP